MTNWNPITPPAPVFYTAEQKAAILADYYAGMKVKAIGVKHGCHECSAARIARRAGLPIRDERLWHRGPSWPAEKVEDLTRLWKEGLSASRIGLLLGTSKGAVIGKKDRLGLTDHGPQKKPVNRKQRERTAKPRTKEQTLADNRLKMRALRTKAPQLIKARPVALPHYPPKHLTLAQLTTTTCRWPLGDGPFTFCGRYTDDGPYCRHHARIAYREPIAA